MIKYPVIRGSGGDDTGGSSGGTPRPPVISPDSLYSISFLRILDLICEGEIVGLVGDSKGVYLNGTRLQNDDDTYNFQNVQWTQRRGTQDQGYISDNPASESEIAVGAQFKYGNPNSGPQPSNTSQTGTAIVRTVVNPECSAVRIRISVPQLLTSNPTTGDVSGASVEYSVWVKAADDVAYVKKLHDTITGKSSSKYERTRRIELSGQSPWLVRVQRETPDSVNSFTQNITVWESYTEIVDAKLRYPNTAVVGISIDATQFSSVPSRAYLMDLLKIKIPSNYDDVTRTYTGVWDGTFQMSTGACNNPAWVFYDMITSERYGLGEYIPESQVNKWALYEIAQYCDELVDDGYGGTEPRFVCNAFIPGRTEAYQLLKSLASVFRGMIHWAGGTIVPTQDAPKDPVFLYNQSNVVDGRFIYQGASAQTRHSVARVSWTDPDNLYETTIEYVEDAQAIKDIGIVETEVIAFGCTSRGQAHRLGRWLLYTEKYESEVVTFNAGLDALACAPGDIIQIADPVKAGIRLGGRIHDGLDATNILLDGDIDPTTTGSLMVFLQNGTLEERDIQSVVGARAVIVDPPFSVAPAQNCIWIIKSDTVEPQPYRVVGIQENENGSYAITALKHFPSKYDFIENDLALEVPQTSILDQTPSAPKNLAVEELLYASTTDVKVKATFSWSPVPFAGNYKVFYTFNNGNRVYLPLTQYNEVDIFDIQPGDYEFGVVAISLLGKESPESKISATIVGKTAPPQDVENFTMIPSHGNAQLYWDRAEDLDVIIGGYVRIRWTPRTTGQTWADAIDITPALTGNSSQIVAPLLTGTYLIKFVDSSGNYSVNPKLVVTDMADIYQLNRVISIDEHPDFGGTLVDMQYDGPEQAITLSSSALFDDVPDVDALPSFDFSGDVVAVGEYYFEDAVDLGGVWPFKVRVHVDLESYDMGNLIDDRPDNIDDWVSFDGDVIDAQDAQVYMRTTQDDPSGTPTWTPWKKIVNAEYIAWGAEFKIICTNDEPSHNMWIRELGVVVDMDDRTFESSKLTSSNSGNVFVDFGNDFFAVPSVAVTAENMSTGDYYTISNLTVAGMDISFYNSSNVRVIRDFYVLAKGYGIGLT